ncbi:hypothetical protein [Rhodococcus sp. BH5]|uniref:hypothetical protein n=1 Tax=Rhodococcus sp. BH5 TaxID=2871702 RepID=UPI0022CD934B|nr:hypothetical protein [Rhodococcus sp. BH5]
MSDGSFIDQPDTLTAGETKRLYRLEHKAARQRGNKPGRYTPSRRLRRTYAQIGGLKARQARRRRDFAHQTTSMIIDSGIAAVMVEDLRVANMTRSGRGTLDAPPIARTANTSVVMNSTNFAIWSALP